MTLASTGDLMLYSGQVLVVISAAAMAVRLLPLSGARAHLAYWRAVMLLCLALPWVPGAPVEPGGHIESALGGSVGAVFEAVSAAAAPWASITRFSFIPAILLAGMVVRLTWLAAGAIRLHRMRERTTPATLDADIECVRQALAPRTDVRWTDEARQPVTFGARRPVVLLPTSFRDLSSAGRFAVACHEFLHVARHDWARTLIDEAVRCVFWFHPAVRWTLGQIELWREQLIDELVVERGADRRAYMAALLAFTDVDATARPALPFLRRSHLVSRIRHLSEERAMSRTQLVGTIAALAMVVAIATWGITRVLPLHGDGDQLAGARFEVRLAEATPGSGLTEVLVSTSGQRLYLHQEVVVTNAEVTAARVTQVSGGSGFNVGIEFSRAGSEKMAAATRAHVGRPMAILVNGDVIAARVLRSVITGSAVITGDFTREEAERIAAAITPTASAQPPSIGEPTTETAAARSPSEASKPRLIKDVKAEYPQDALSKRIAGVVMVQTTIGVDGAPTEVRVVSGPEPLRQAAVDAIKQWRWEPLPQPITVECEIRFMVPQRADA